MLSNKYNLVYQRYADFSDSTKELSDYGVELVNNSVDEVDVAISNGVVSLAFDAEDTKKINILVWAHILLFLISIVFLLDIIAK